MVWDKSKAPFSRLAGVPALVRPPHAAIPEMLHGAGAMAGLRVFVSCM